MNLEQKNDRGGRKRIEGKRKVNGFNKNVV